MKEETKEIDLEETELQELKTTGEMALVIKGIISPVAKDICKHKALGEKISLATTDLLLTKLLILPSTSGRSKYYFTSVHALKFKKLFSPLSAVGLSYCKQQFILQE